MVHKFKKTTKNIQTSLVFGFFGSILPPPGVSAYVDPNKPGAGLFSFLSNLFLLAGVIAGIYAAFQFIMAGFSFMGTGGDPKKFEQAWNKIWQAIIGLLVVASAFTLTAVIGRFLGIGNILQPIIYGPGP